MNRKTIDILIRDVKIIRHNDTIFIQYDLYLDGEFIVKSLLNISDDFNYAFGKIVEILKKRIFSRIEHYLILLIKFALNLEIDYMNFNIDKFISELITGKYEIIFEGWIVELLNNYSSFVDERNSIPKSLFEKDYGIKKRKNGIYAKIYIPALQKFTFIEVKDYYFDEKKETVTIKFDPIMGWILYQP